MYIHSGEPDLLVHILPVRMPTRDHKIYVTAAGRETRVGNKKENSNLCPLSYFIRKAIVLPSRTIQLNYSDRRVILQLTCRQLINTVQKSWKETVEVKTHPGAKSCTTQNRLTKTVINNICILEHLLQ